LLFALCGCNRPVAFVASSPGICSPDGWCWENPLPQPNAHRAVWGEGDSFFVGTSVCSILRHDGTTGSWEASIRADADACWAYWPSPDGEVFVAAGDGRILRFHDGAWRPSTDTGDMVFDIWGTSSKDVFAVGEKIWHFDGDTWSSQPVPSGETLFAVWGTSPTHVLAGGSHSLVLELDGKTWSTVYSSAESGVVDHISGTGADNVFAVGRNKAVLRHDGKTWRSLAGDPGWDQLPSFCRDNGFDASWPDGPGQAQFVGSGCHARHDGARWSLIHHRHDLLVGIDRLTKTGTGDVVAVGGLGTIALFDGASWSSLRTDFGYPPRKHDLSGRAFIGVSGSSFDNVWALGEKGKVARFDGKAWTIAGELPPGSAPSGIWVGGADSVFVSSRHQAIHRFNGSKLTTAQVAAQSPFAGIWGASPEDVFALETSGQLWRFDGSTWRPRGDASSHTLNAIGGTSPKNVVMVGDAGVVIRYDGQMFRSMNAGTSERLTAVWAVEDAVFAGAYSGSVSHFDGSRWSTMPSGTKEAIAAIWGSGRTDVYAVGGGKILHYDGSRWRSLGRHFDRELNAIWGSGAYDIVMVGTEGAILRHSP
jgi:hypothetical protein